MRAKDRHTGARYRDRHRAAVRERGRIERQKRYAANPELAREQGRAYYAANADAERAKAARYREANRERLRLKDRQKYAADPEKARTRAEEYRRRKPEVAKLYRRANKDQGYAATRARKALRRGAPHSDLSPAQWLEIQVVQDHHCYYCGKPCKGKLTQDHLVPVSKGGSHTLHNVIGACQSCNSRKGTKPPPIPVQPLLLTVAPAKKGKA